MKTKQKFISEAFDWSGEHVGNDLGIVLAAISPTRYQDMIFHLASQLEDMTLRLEQYQNLDLCKECTRAYIELTEHC